MGRLGLPVVSLTKRTLPKLTSRNSCKFGRGPVMVKVAPQEPYSPFKRYSSPSERSEHQVRTPREEHNNSSSDPRQVIAVLAELSGKRTRRPSDEMSLTGSKRARRDSSSSLGSSLSMEMPPLFQNGVVGQTTSHLVSRETDLSLGSLLSRNQSLFGHSVSIPSSPMPLHHSMTSVPTVNAQSQTVNPPKPDLTSSTDMSVSMAIEASLSSSRCLLKRNRDEFEDDDSEKSDNEDKTPKVAQKKSNVFRSPDKEKKKKNFSPPPKKKKKKKKKKKS